MKKGMRRSIIGLFFLVSILTSFCLGYSLRSEKEESEDLGETRTVQAIPNISPYTVTLEENTLILYENGEAVKSLPVDLRSVSPDVREALHEGVNADSIEEIYYLLEDITS